MSRINTLDTIRQREQQQFNVVRREQSTGNTCLDIIKIIFPGFHINTVTFRYAVVCACVFAVMKATQIMRPQTEWPCIEYTFGAKYTYAISRKYQIWRLIAPMFIHDTSVQMFWNMFSLFMVGFMVESLFSESRYAYIKLLALGGISGNLASANMQPYEMGVGSSGAIFAVFGSFFVYIYIQFEKMDENVTRLAILLGVIFVFSLVMALLSEQADVYNNLGGLAVGVPFGALYLKTDQTNIRKIYGLRASAYSFLLLYFAILTGLTMLRPLPECDERGCDKVCQ